MNLAIAIGLVALAFTILLSLPRREKPQEPPPKDSDIWANWPPR